MMVSEVVTKGNPPGRLPTRRGRSTKAPPECTETPGLGSYAGRAWVEGSVANGILNGNTAVRFREHFRTDKCSERFRLSFPRRRVHAARRVVAVGHRKYPHPRCVGLSEPGRAADPSGQFPHRRLAGGAHDFTACRASGPGRGHRRGLVQCRARCDAMRDPSTAAAMGRETIPTHRQDFAGSGH